MTKSRTPDIDQELVEEYDRLREKAKDYRTLILHGPRFGYYNSSIASFFLVNENIYVNHLV